MLEENAVQAAGSHKHECLLEVSAPRVGIFFCSYKMNLKRASAFITKSKIATTSIAFSYFVIRTYPPFVKIRRQPTMYGIPNK